MIDDDDEYRTIGGMKTDRGNRSTRKKETCPNATLFPTNPT
jgi:hypothetical protein